ncbi:sepiapterin reductase-like [Mizuhopecten yessoensis]|uniref:Sepiapterin reductase n=1 Tax=Mizuhopecten yessoensis TaxID=6573 RepID=A0A210PTA1_MIZYE|nr:sepiapterin reductase-like [Mizuhopecten yessoensis]OWF39686.1 Sepiapterin reductase [Mizuhopecten yessoensis]
MAEHPNIFLKKTFVAITGASRGLGRSIALQFGAKFPNNSVMVLMDVLPLDSVKSELLSGSRNMDVLVRHFDQGNLEDKYYFKGIFTKLLQEYNFSQNNFEQYMIVHNCATLCDVSKKSLELSDSTSVRKYFDINLTGMILLNSSFFQTFSDSTKSRVIVNMTSAVTSTPMASVHLYCAAKAARDIYMRVLAVEEPSLRILTFAPGISDTDMTKQAEQLCFNKTNVDMIKKTRANGKMTLPDTPVGKLVQILEENKFENAVYVESDDISETINRYM